jgi:hypothetical protein
MQRCAPEAGPVFWCDPAPGFAPPLLPANPLCREESPGLGTRSMAETTYLDRRFAQAPSIVSRQIAGESILVPIRQTAGEVESIYTLNEVAARAWELLDGQRRLSEIRDLIVAEFEVGAEEAGADLVEFLQQLERVGAVREA